MSSRLAEIDHLLARCAIQLKPNTGGVVDVKRVRLLVDDLLDERNKITGVPRPTNTHLKVCSMRYQPLRVVRIQPHPQAGGIAVDFTNCMVCDRAKCRCGTYVTDITAKQCPAGHWLDRQGQASV